MTNEHEEKVAGVTMHLKNASQQQPQGLEKLRVLVTLECYVNDEALWKVVENKFITGYRVFTAEDFHVEVMDVMREQIKLMEQQLFEAGRALTQAADAKALVEKELAAYKEPYQRFKAALGG